MAGLKEAKELGPRMDALEEKFDALIDVLKKELNKPTPAPKIPEPKPDPRIGEIVIELGELREMIKRAATPPPKEDSSTLGYIIVCVVVVLCVFGVDCIALKLMKDNPRTDYAERILYNMQYANDGTGKDGTGIRIFDDEEKAQKIMNNQYKYEQSEKKKAVQ